MTFYPSWEEFCGGVTELLLGKPGADSASADIVDFDFPEQPFRVEIRREKAEARDGRMQMALTVQIAAEASEAFVKKTEAWLEIVLREFVKADPSHILVMPRFSRA
jgi:hypothetical protein